MKEQFAFELKIKEESQLVYDVLEKFPAVYLPGVPEFPVRLLYFQPVKKYNHNTLKTFIP